MANLAQQRQLIVLNRNEFNNYAVSLNDFMQGYNITCINGTNEREIINHFGDNYCYLRVDEDVNLPKNNPKRYIITHNLPTPNPTKENQRFEASLSPIFIIYGPRNDRFIRDLAEINLALNDFYALHDYDNTQDPLLLGSDFDEALRITRRQVSKNKDLWPCNNLIDYSDYLRNDNFDKYFDYVYAQANDQKHTFELRSKYKHEEDQKKPVSFRNPAFIDYELMCEDLEDDITIINKRSTKDLLNYFGQPLISDAINLVKDKWAYHSNFWRFYSGSNKNYIGYKRSLKPLLAEWQDNKARYEQNVDSNASTDEWTKNRLNRFFSIDYTKTSGNNVNTLNEDILKGNKQLTWYENIKRNKPEAIEEVKQEDQELTNSPNVTNEFNTDVDVKSALSALYEHLLTHHVTQADLTRNDYKQLPNFIAAKSIVDIPYAVLSKDYTTLMKAYMPQMKASYFDKYYSIIPEFVYEHNLDNLFNPFEKAWDYPHVKDRLLAFNITPGTKQTPHVPQETDPLPDPEQQITSTTDYQAISERYDFDNLMTQADFQKYVVFHVKDLDLNFLYHRLQDVFKKTFVYAILEFYQRTDRKVLVPWLESKTTPSNLSFNDLLHDPIIQTLYPNPNPNELPDIKRAFDEPKNQTLITNLFNLTGKDMQTALVLDQNLVAFIGFVKYAWLIKSKEQEEQKTSKHSMLK